MNHPQNQSRKKLILLVDEYRRLAEEKSISLAEFLGAHPHVNADEFQRELDWDRKFDWGRFASSENRPSQLLSEFLTGDCDLAEPMLRTVLDQRFEERAVLGQGGFGLVLRCFDREMERDVAVKIPRNLNRTDRDFMVKEARAAANIKHPNVATIYDVIKVGDSAMIVSEFIDGKTLRQKLDCQESMDCNDAVRLGIAVAEGVQAAHNNDLIHGDLKPANIIVDSQGRPQIIDFGLSVRTQDGKTLPDQIVGGTPQYMAPEQTLGYRSKITRAVDVYSLGLILMELLLGSTDHSLEQIKQLFDTNDATRRFRIPSDLVAICRRCVAESPGDRYQHANDLAQDLKRFTEYYPVRAKRYSLWERTWMWCKRNRTLATGLASAAVLAVFIIAALSWINAQSQAAEARQRQLTTLARLERDKATDARQKSDQILQFVQDNVFRSFNTQAFGGLGKEIRLRDAVVAAMNNVDQSFQDQPETSASLHYVLGEVLYELGENAFAADEFEKAFEIYKRVEGEDSLDTLKSRRATLMARVEISDNTSDEYAALIEVKDKLVKTLGKNHPESLRTHITLSRASGTNHAQGVAHAQIAYDGFLAINGDSDLSTISAASCLGFRLQHAGETDKSLDLFKTVYERCLDALGPKHGFTLVAGMNLALAMKDTGKSENRTALLEQILATSDEALVHFTFTANIVSNGVLLWCTK
ncbi:MAG: serine/threonine-protein kinase [Pirellulaceae bacterium]